MTKPKITIVMMDDRFFHASLKALRELREEYKGRGEIFPLERFLNKMEADEHKKPVTQEKVR
jgi:hypothetical protein